MSEGLGRQTTRGLHVSPDGLCNLGLVQFEFGVKDLKVVASFPNDGTWNT